MKQKQFKYNNIVWTEHDLALLLNQFIAERKVLLAVQFSGKASSIQMRRITDLNNRIRATNQLLNISKVA